MQKIIEYSERLSRNDGRLAIGAEYIRRRTDLEHVSPVLALVIEPLIEHLHDLDKVVPDHDQPQHAYEQLLAPRQIYRGGRKQTHWL